MTERPKNINDLMAVRALRALTVAALIFPPILLCYACWSDYRNLDQLVTQRIESTLDVLQEHSLKVFQTTTRVLVETQQLVGLLRVGRSAELERTTHQALAELQRAVPEIESIWAFDRNGHPIVSSTIYPVPANLDNSDRDYFRAQRDLSAGIYVGENIKARIGSSTFFVVSKRLAANDNSFDGIVAITLPPDSLSAFYEKLTKGSGLAAGLFRADGTVLARFPLPPSGLSVARTNSTFIEALRTNADEGEYEARSGVDGVVRRIAYRKVAGYPLYVTAAFDQNIFWKDFLSRCARDLALGLPAALLLILMSSIALRRTRRLVSEYEKRQQAEAALKQAQRLEAVGQLTGGVAHDFNNLLMVIQGNAQRLRRESLSPIQERAVNAISEATKRGESLTRQLLTFSRRQTVMPEVIDLGAVLPRLAEMLRTSLRGNINVELQIPSEIWNVEVDLSELELAILNLAVNARDAMPNGGLLVLGAENIILSEPSRKDSLFGEYVKLFVRDGGSGIPPEVLPRVFEPFFTTKEVNKGTGLGLSQVYGFAAQAGGSAEVVSKVGEGTEVTVFLPKTRLPVSRKPEATRNVTGYGPWTILIVEDNSAIAEVTSSNMRTHGHEVLIAQDAQEALRILGSASTVDLVLSDIVMPGMNGVELAKEIKERFPSMPVILATGYSDAAKSAKAEGFTIIPKPYTVEGLLEVASEVLSVATGSRRSAN